MWEDLDAHSYELPADFPGTQYLRDKATANAYINLALALLVERNRGSQSPFFRYIMCLPKVIACPSLLCFTPVERAQLADPFAAEIAERDQQTLLDVLRHMPLHEWELRGFSVPPGQHEWLWAIGMTLSRAFTTGGVPRLLPFVDALNHHPDAGEIQIISPTALIDEADARSPPVGGGHGGGSVANGHLAPRNSPSSDDAAPALAAHVGEASSVQGAPTEVGAWRKYAPASHGVREGDELTWAYKLNASQFDLLYLYGFVSDHPAHDMFPVAVQWAAPSHDTMIVARRIFKRIGSAVLLREDLEGHEMHVTLRFASSGLLAETVQTVRVMAICAVTTAGFESNVWGPGALNSWGTLYGSSEPLAVMAACADKGQCAEIFEPQLGLGAHGGGGGYGGGGAGHLTTLEAFVEAEAIRILKRIAKDLTELTIEVEKKQPKKKKKSSFIRDLTPHGAVEDSPRFKAAAKFRAKRSTALVATLVECDAAYNDLEIEYGSEIEPGGGSGVTSTRHEL